MATDAQARVQHAVEGMLESLEKEQLRPILRKAHLGSAKCCENTQASKQQLEQCMQATFQPAQQIQQTISNELNSFQNRLQRCAQSCQDQAQDHVTPGTTQDQVTLIQTGLEKCVTNCCDSHINLIPNMMARINQVLHQVGGVPNFPPAAN